MKLPIIIALVAIYFEGPNVLGSHVLGIVVNDAALKS